MSVANDLTASPVSGDVTIERIRCVSAHPSSLAGLFEAVGADDVIVGSSRLSVAVGETSLEFDSGETKGIVGIDLVASHQEAASVASLSPRLEHLSGVDVSIEPRVGVASLDPSVVTRERTRIDHVAIVVADLGAAEQRWSSILGVPSEAMGIHPASNGGFRASRMVIGAQMIELICPLPGVDSSVARRLATHGDGPVTLAMPVGDLAGAVRRLESQSIRVLRTEHHVMIHPKDAGGLLLQLTPRVEHDPDH